MKTIKIKSYDEIPTNFTGRAEWPNGPNGHKEWYKEGKLHRLDGPAVEWVKGITEWFKEGKHHRLDGQAIEWVNGYKEWLVEGKLHRLDGPAVELFSVDKQWWVEDKRVIEEDFQQVVLDYKLRTVLES